MLILESAVMVTPPLLHWTVTSVPEIHVQLKDTFLLSTATEGTYTVTPVTASTKGNVKKKEAFYLRCTQRKCFLNSHYCGHGAGEREREYTSKARVTEQ